MGQVRDTAQSLYQSGSLLGFAIASNEGEMIHNESFFSDEAANQALSTLASCTDQLIQSGRNVSRLTVGMDDVTVIYSRIHDRDRRGMFLIDPSQDLDAAASQISELALDP